jgi:DNA-binding response OmpR family regulator
MGDLAGEFGAVLLQFEQVMAQLRSLHDQMSRLGERLADGGLSHGSAASARVIVNRNQRVITLDGKDLAPPGKLFEIMAALCEDVGDVASFSRIEELVWERGYGASPGQFYNLISKTRRALEAQELAYSIENVRGWGYRLRQPQLQDTPKRSARVMTGLSEADGLLCRYLSAHAFELNGCRE